MSAKVKGEKVGTSLQDRMANALDEIMRYRAEGATKWDIQRLLAEYRAQKAQPQISQETALAMLSRLRCLSQIFNDSNFTDRYGDGELIDEIIARAEAELKEGA